MVFGDRAAPDRALKEQAALLEINPALLSSRPVGPAPEEETWPERTVALYTARPLYGALPGAGQAPRASRGLVTWQNGACPRAPGLTLGPRAAAQAG